MKTEEPVVTLAWASKKRHIYLNGNLLCQYQHTGQGYHAGLYNTVAIHGLPVNVKSPDADHVIGKGGMHDHGTIPFLPLDEIAIEDTQGYFSDTTRYRNVRGVIRRSICKMCQKRYDKLILLKKVMP